MSDEEMLSLYQALKNTEYQNTIDVLGQPKHSNNNKITLTNLTLIDSLIC